MKTWIVMTANGRVEIKADKCEVFAGDDKIPKVHFYNGRSFLTSGGQVACFQQWHWVAQLEALKTS